MNPKVRLLTRKIRIMNEHAPYIAHNWLFEAARYSQQPDAFEYQVIDAKTRVNSMLRLINEAEETRKDAEALKQRSRYRREYTAACGGTDDDDDEEDGEDLPMARRTKGKGKVRA
jgi:hypothetical protein